MGSTILIVDDTDSYKNKLKLLFEHQGHRVHTSSTVDKTVNLVNGLVKDKKIPDLIILELRLPGAFGLSALRSIHTALDTHRVPIVVVSWGFDKLARSHMALLGALGYVEKPVLLEALHRFAEVIMKDHKEKLSQEQSLEAEFLADLNIAPSPKAA